MLPRLVVGGVVVVLSALSANPARAQTSATDLAQLLSLRDKVRDPETRVRVAALHRVWTLGLASSDPALKLTALELLGEPVGSSSDHIRMPAVYAIAEIAASTSDSKVKVRALTALGEPLRASQVPIRDVAIDAVNLISRSADDPLVSQAAVRALGEPVRSGNNGVRIPAINAIVRAVERHYDPVAVQTALDLLVAALESDAMIGGMEARMMAVAAMEKIAGGGGNVATKARAMGLLQAYATRGGWEAESRARAADAARAIEATLSKP
jgi:hypothetical protein